MAVVGNLWVTTSFRSFAGVSARRRKCAAREWWLKDSPSAMTAYVLEDSLPTRPARALVAQLFTNVISTLERSSTLTSANMLCFNPIINRSRGRMQRTLLLLGSLTLDRLALTRAATLFACMSSAVEICSAYSPALRLFFVTLMADGR